MSSNYLKIEDLNATPPYAEDWAQVDDLLFKLQNRGFTIIRDDYALPMQPMRILRYPDSVWEIHIQETVQGLRAWAPAATRARSPFATTPSRGDHQIKLGGMMRFEGWILSVLDLPG
jgi:hypothetical protein